MSTDQDASTNLLDDLKNITETLLQDGDGERARQLVAYFEQCAVDSEQQRLRCEDARERQLSELMRDAYQACASIVSTTWGAMHSATLN
jgi:hypothetical protein